METFRRLGSIEQGCIVWLGVGVARDHSWDLDFSSTELRPQNPHFRAPLKGAELGSNFLISSPSSVQLVLLFYYINNA